MELIRKRVPHIFERVRPNGRVVEIRGTPIAGGGFVTSYTDVTENRQRQASVAEQALTDPLTGLSNRLHFDDRLSHAFAFAKRGEHFALHFIDLDDFKPINDKFGHEAGDIVLKEIARLLKNVLRETDTVARLGGDEFVITQSKVQYVEKCRIWRVPVAVCALETRQILKQADWAMYESKKHGKDTITVFEATS